jgi:uncharacterized OB-fold protein
MKGNRIMSDKNNAEPLVHDIFQQITYHYNTGAYGTKFMKSLKESKQILGVKCDRCAKVYTPPRIVCPECFEKLENWVPVGPKGSLIGGTAINHAFPDPLTGELRETPYGYGLILLDGASTNWCFFLEATEVEQMQPGRRVEAVFAEERTGDISDILHFKIVEE